MERGIRRKNRKEVQNKESRNSQSRLSEWTTFTNNDIYEQGIAEYYSRNGEFCSEVQLVSMDKINESQKILPQLHWNKAAVMKPACAENDDSNNIFDKDLVSLYLYQAQTKPTKSRIKSTRKSRSADKRGVRNKSVTDEVKNCGQENKQKLAAVNAENVGKVKTVASRKSQLEVLESTIFLPQKQESFISPIVSRQFRLTKQSAEKTRNDLKPINKCEVEPPCRDSRSRIRGSPNNYVTCPSHVYAFQRGLVSSKEAQGIEPLPSRGALPPVIADKILKSIEQKHYRLTLDRDNTTKGSQSECSFAPDIGTDQKIVSSKMFSAEEVIPVSRNGRTYFDFKGYIDYLCKERHWRKMCEQSSTECRRSLQNTAAESWLKLGNFDHELLDKGFYNYRETFNIKGCQIKLDQSRNDVKSPTDAAGSADSNPHEHCCVGNSRKAYVKTYKTTHRHKEKQTEKNTGIIIKRLPSHFQFIMPGRTPSSSDSGYAE